MYYYKLRITCEDIPIEAAIEFVNKTTTLWAYGIEYKNLKTREGLHIHFYIETEKIQKTFVQSIRRWYPNFTSQKGNSVYSLKALDSEKPIEYLSYITKQGECDLSSLEPEIVEQAKARDEEYKQHTKSQKHSPVWKKILQLVIDINPSRWELDNVIKEQIHRYHVENELLIRKHQYITYFDTIKAQMDPEITPQSYMHLFN